MPELVLRPERGADYLLTDHRDSLERRAFGMSCTNYFCRRRELCDKFKINTDKNR
jgi:hypothetical protein